MSTLKKNLAFQSLYQFLAVCIPFITSPYLSRTLGAEQIGVYSYTYSIVNYFMLVAILGVSSYGMREIASCHSKEETSRTFCEIFEMQLISSLLSIAVYVILLWTVISKYRIQFMIEIIYIVSELININWLFFGLEKYKNIVIRNTIVKVLTTVALFVFVKNSNDLNKYILIMSGGTFISSAILWKNIFKIIDFKFVPLKNIKKHLKPTLVLFIPILAASIYHYMDKTMLGFYSDEANSGYYYYADKIANIPLTIITSCSNVFMSRTTRLIGEDNRLGASNVQTEALNFGFCVISIISFGIISVADQFIPLFLGEGYDPCINIAKAFALIIIFRMLSTTIRSVYLIPEKKDSIYAKAVLGGVIVNFIANYILIKTFALGALGATIGTFIAEFSVFALQIVLIRDRSERVCIYKNMLRSLPYLLFGAVMTLVLYFAGMVINNWNALLCIFVKVIIGGIVYLAMCGIYWKCFPSRMPDMISETFASIKKKLKLS